MIEEVLLKAIPPREIKSAIQRERLSMFNGRQAGKTVVSLCAPAGYGKTSLLLHWRRELLFRGGMVAWLTLDESDDVGAFLRALAESMRMASGRATFAHPSMSTGLFINSLTSWLAAVAGLGAEVLLILDDVHRLSSAIIDGPLSYLLRQLPTNLRVALSSRRHMTHVGAHLFERGEMAEMGAAELRLRPEESFAILRLRFGERMDLDVCGRLHNVSEGWPLGLQLAAAAIDINPRLQADVLNPHVAGGDLERYFLRSLVDALPGELADFLVRISIVEDLHPDLAQTITGAADAAQRLTQLRELTPIVCQVGDGQWVRLHALARTFLATRAAALSQEDTRAAHERAALWFGEQGRYAQAARHARLAQRVDLFERFVDLSLYDLVENTDVGRLIAWGEELMLQSFGRDPKLRLAVSLALGFTHYAYRVREWISAVRPDYPVGSLERYQADLCLAEVSTATDQLDDCAEILAHVQPPSGRLELRLQLSKAACSAYVALHRGSPEQARSIMREVMSQPGIERDGLRRACQYIEGFSYLWEARLHDAKRCLSEYLAECEAEQGRRSPLAMIMAFTLASAHCESGEANEALLLLADRFDLLDSGAGATPTIAEGFVTAARLACGRADVERALSLLHRLEQLGREKRLPRFITAAAREAAHIHALLGHVDSCVSIAQALEGEFSQAVADHRGILAPLLDLNVIFTRAYARLASQQWRALLTLAQQADRIAKSLCRNIDSVHAKLLAALALKRLGEAQAPMLEEACSLAELHGLVRVLSDTHPDVDPNARDLGVHPRLHRAGEPTALPGQARPWQAQHRAAGSPGRLRVVPTALLTPKERDILQLLLLNQSNKEIARAVASSEETVKWHLKNLYAKLQVGNRRQVADRARLLGILDSSG